MKLKNFTYFIIGVVLLSPLASAKLNEKSLLKTPIRGQYTQPGVVTALKANLEGKECTGTIADTKFELDNCDTVSAGEVMRILNASYLLKKKIVVILEGGDEPKILLSATYAD